MATLNRAPFNALADDDGSGNVGTVWEKVQIKDVLLDPIDVAIAPLGPLPTAALGQLLVSQGAGTPPVFSANPVASTFTASQTSPDFLLIDTSQTANNRRFRINAQSQYFLIDAQTDAGTLQTRLLQFTRAGVAAMPGPLTVSGGLATTPLNATNLTVGIVPDARLSVNVLTHAGGYPGGTTNFLRADGTFAAPSATGGLAPPLVQSGSDIFLNTADGADNGGIRLSSGGGYGSARGAGFQIFGNESSLPGQIYLDMGNVGVAALFVRNGAAANVFSIDATGVVFAANRLQIAGTGASHVGLRSAVGVGGYPAALEVIAADGLQWATCRAANFVSVAAYNNFADLTCGPAAFTNYITVAGTATFNANENYFVSASHARIHIRETTQPAGGQTWTIMNHQAALHFSAPPDDAGMGWSSMDVLKLDRGGGASFAGAIISGSVIYPGRVDVAGGQVSWYLGSHASYGLYSNTGLYLTGHSWTVGTVYALGGYVQLSYPHNVRPDRNDQVLRLCGGMGDTTASGAIVDVVGGTASGAGSINCRLGNQATGDFRVQHGNSTLLFRVTQQGDLSSHSWGGANQFIFNAGDGTYKYMEFQVGGWPYGWIGNSGGLGGGGASGNNDMCIRAGQQLILAADSLRIIAYPAFANAVYVGGDLGNAHLTGEGLFCRASSGLVRRSAVNGVAPADWRTTLTLKPVTYDLTVSPTLDIKKRGFVRQCVGLLDDDVQAADPRLVFESDGETRLDQRAILALAIATIQNLHARLEAVERDTRRY